MDDFDASQAQAIADDCERRRFERWLKREGVVPCAQGVDPRPVLDAKTLREMMGRLYLVGGSYVVPALSEVCPDFQAHLDAAIECLKPFLCDAEARERELAPFEGSGTVEQSTTSTLVLRPAGTQAMQQHSILAQLQGAADRRDRNHFIDHILQRGGLLVAQQCAQASQVGSMVRFFDEGVRDGSLLANQPLGAKV